MGKSKQNEIKLFPYRDQWEKAFLKEKKIIEKELGGYFFEIEHIGSTAVPNMWSTLVIDILIAIDDLADIDKFENSLTEMGYARSGISHGPKHLVYSCETQQGFSIHFLEVRHLAGTHYVKFRDALIADPKLTKEYKEFKVKLTGNYKCDSKWYMAEKSKWILAKMKALNL